MKLVDILARELKVWPNDQYEAIGQASDGTLHKSPNWDIGCGWSEEKYTMAEDWSRVHVTRAKWQAAVDALKAEKVVEWNGEGLPPVGVVCEILQNKTTSIWVSVKIIAHVTDDPRFNPIAIYIPEGDPSATVGQAVASTFRPIRTPEQIAAEERLQEIADALTATSKTVDPWNVDINCSSAIRATVEAMIDAGYRKFEIVDN
jgi:hypothetical protein